MAETPRVYAGLDVTWPEASGGEDDPMAGLVLAETDAFGPSAAEVLPAGLRIFFRSNADRESAAAHLRHALPDCSTASVDVSDEGWAERSQASLKAIQAGGLTVAPPWDAPVDRTSTIIIQPSMGFGTGHHASTRLCLRLLQAASVSGARVLDAGTGSGVLAIAAWKLGARSVTAVDVDADAIASALECAGLNDAADAIDFRPLDLENQSIEGAPFDLVLANLTGGMLVRLAAPLSQLVVSGGTLIVSGVMLEEEERVARAFLECEVRVVERLTEEEWVGLRLQR